jgi:RHS repeat-associated protein
MDYIGDIVYQNGSLLYIGTEEGRALFSGSNINYQYDIKDHLGSVRITFDKDPSTNSLSVAQENHFYPFGLPMQGGMIGSPENLDQYNGKEVQHDLGGLYDYGARMHDPARAGFITSDPLAEHYHSVSPYNYAANNPIRYRDKNGEGPWDVVKGFVAAVVDNATLGLVDLRETLSPSDRTSVEAQDYDQGQDGGELFSITAGAATAEGGGTISSGSVVVLVGSGGTTGAVTIPAAVVGAAAVSYGATVTAKATFNLATQKGRVCKKCTWKFIKKSKTDR